jgi:hypothetical protein
VTWRARRERTGTTRWADAWLDHGLRDKAAAAVGMALKLHANNSSGEAFPAQRTIAAWTRYSERHVRRVLERLEREGWIERSRRTGSGLRKNLTSYLLTIPPHLRTCRPDAAEGRVPVPVPGGTGHQMSGARNEATGHTAQVHRTPGPKAPDVRCPLNSSLNSQERTLADARANRSPESVGPIATRCMERMRGFVEAGPTGGATDGSGASIDALLKAPAGSGRRLNES